MPQDVSTQDGPLAELIDELTVASKSEIGDDEFRGLLTKTVIVLELDVDTVADACLTSRTAVNRWLAGTARPHKKGRPSVFIVLLKIAAHRAEHDASLRSL